jgi:glutamate 5-kinase
MILADCLIILSDVDGLYSDDPDRNAHAPLVDHVVEITDEIEAMAGAARTVGMGSGGMVTKLAAAKIAVPSGCQVLIVNGTGERPIRAYKETGRGTWFEAVEAPATARKQWIAGALKPMGKITIDGGAEDALGRGKSLLPAGVTAVEGNFERGDPVTVQAADGRELARGLVAYSADEARIVMGHRSDAIEELLGYRDRGELIHRDHLVLL